LAVAVATTPTPPLVWTGQAVNEVDQGLARPPQSPLFWLERSIQRQYGDPVRLPAAEFTPPESLASAYLDALLVGDRETAEVGVRQALLDGSSLNDIYVNVFQEALYEVGRRWERAELSVAQEHFCTAATQQLMASLYEQTLQTPKVGHRLLATSIGGNFHSVGIRMLADVFELHGWETTYLGADTPSAAVIGPLTSGSYDVLAISAGLEQMGITEQLPLPLDEHK
jgi:methanogenic corrinoid protein MtbC1